jgi:hypothetical protein
VKLGGGLTVSATVVVAVRLPEVPVMVTVAAPVAAVLLAVRVSTLLPVVGLVAKAALTPLGRPEAARVTLPAKPPMSCTVMVRVKAVRKRSGDPILPALYDDNNIALMPGERKTIHVELENADTRGERPRILIRGYNVASP